MAAATEALPLGAQGFRSSALKRPVGMARGDARLVVDAEGAVRSLSSLSERRVLFGRGQLYFYKVQAGVVVAPPRPDWSFRTVPGAVSLAARLFDVLEVSQSLEFSQSTSVGYVRRLKLRNSSSSALRLRLISVADPTSAHFRENSGWWGSLGVNAFNRESHVAMDEISEPHPARVVGSYPGPSKVYMTTERGRGSELLQAGDLPESTAGMSGQVLILTLHELELAPSESKEVTFASFYSPRKLEDVLSDFGKLQSGDRGSARRDFAFACSSPRVTEAFFWARQALEGAPFEQGLLERLETLRGIEYLEPQQVEGVFSRSKGKLMRDGLLQHSDDPSQPGILESSLLLSGMARHLVLANDKKAARPYYPSLKKTADALSGLSRAGSVQLGPGAPQGWRRLVGSGYPSGEVPEVSLAVASSLSDFGRVARLLGKGEDGAKLREKAELITDAVGKRLVDERGFLGLCIDYSGKMRTDETIDMAVSCFRNPSLRSVASSGVHRLLEKDFETDYGPRTVPTTNKMYFHQAYGQGQLGGYWTRAVLAYSCLAYAVGLPGMGSLALEKVAKLVTEDYLRYGGVPGEFPYWVDIESREAHGERSDPVAAARFVQAVVEGELGLTIAGGSPSLNPPVLSTLKWLFARDLWAGERLSAFVGRGAGKSFAWVSSQRAEPSSGQRFAKCEQAEASPRGTYALVFHGPGQTVCVGNSASAPVRAKVALSAKSPGLAKRLSTPLEEFEPRGGTWNKIGSLRVTTEMTFDVPLGSGDWKAFRISTD